MDRDKIDTAYTLIRQGLTLIEEAKRPSNDTNYIASILLGLPILGVLFFVLV